MLSATDQKRGRSGATATHPLHPNLEGLTCLSTSYGGGMPPHSEFMHVSEAAERLGVVVQTVRNWIAAGKLRAKRHPMNQYRLILKRDIEALAQAIQAPPTKIKSRQKSG